MQVLLKYYRELLIVVLVASLYFTYNKYTEVSSTNNELTTKLANVNTDIQIVEKIVEIRPDGTKIVTEKETKDKSTETVAESSEKTETETKIASKSRYSLEVLHPVNAFDANKIQIGVGARIGDLPAFGTVHYNFENKDILLGIRLEF